MLTHHGIPSHRYVALLRREKRQILLRFYKGAQRAADFRYDCKSCVDRRVFVVLAT